MDEVACAGILVNLQRPLKGSVIVWMEDKTFNSLSEMPSTYSEILTLQFIVTGVTVLSWNMYLPCEIDSIFLIQHGESQTYDYSKCSFILNS